MPPEQTVTSIVETVRESPKYANFTRSMVEHVARIELAKGRKPKETVKAVKNRLHQAVGAYADQRPKYDEWLMMLRAADSAEALKTACHTILGRHASARERLAILDEFYTTLLGDLPPVTSILDAACGLNPLAIPFMPLAPDARYIAIDVMDDMMAFLREAMPLLGMRGEAVGMDVTAEVPAGAVDVAMLIKAIPCLQQIDRTVGTPLLQSLNARTVIVTYPVRSLGGSEKGMRSNYADSFAALVDGQGWGVERFDFPDELGFRITKPLKPSG